MEYSEAMRIFDQNVHELQALPGSISVSITAKGLVVRTTNPSMLPKQVQGLPVHPLAENAGQELLPMVTQNQSEQPNCPPGLHRKEGEERCQFDSVPEEGKSKMKLNPPPEGVVVLKQGKKEHALKCPKDYKEVDGYGGWKFCVDPQNPEPIPDLWSPLVGGVSRDKAQEIHKRHVERLGRLPGVESVGLGVDAIEVSTSNPSIVPKEIEGIPVKVIVVPERQGRTLSHTYSSAVRPLHGAVTVTEPTYAGGYGTLTGIALSGGKPWMIFPAHFLGVCDNSPDCSGAVPLNDCPHYNTGRSALLLQPVTQGVGGSIGWSNRWTPVGPTFYSLDVAAGFVDSNFIEGDGSLSVDRNRHSANAGVAFSGVAIPALPPVGLRVKMVSSIGPPHELELEVVQTNTVANNIANGCQGGGVSFINSQIKYKVLGGYTTTGGDSGSPVFDGAGRLVSMINACYLRYQDYVGWVCDPNLVYGTDILATRGALKYDALYGTGGIVDNTIGLFNTSTTQWYIDNGNGKMDTCSVNNPTALTDQCTVPWGWGTDTPVSGDWDGNGSTTIGVYRSVDIASGGTCAPHTACFLLSNSNVSPAVNRVFNTGPVTFGYKPVTGNWPGSRAGTKVGVFLPSTGEWALDNGDYSFVGCTGGDICFTTPGSISGDIPFVGDWLGNGQMGPAFFRPSTGAFYFKSGFTSGYMTASSIIASPTYKMFPIVGNWIGVGTKTQFGLYVYGGTSTTPIKPYPYWYLDNGNRAYGNCVQDQCYTFRPSGLTPSTLRPVVFGRSVVKAN